MTQPAKVQEPSMEEILASIRRIIADDDAKPAEKAATADAPAAPPRARPAATPEMPPSAATAPRAAPATAEPAADNSQDDIDALLAGLDATTSEAEVRP